MLHLHANVYASPPGVERGPTVTVRGLELATLRADDGGPPRFHATLPVTFEEAESSLGALPRCDFEPDGFFLLTGHEDGVFWRLNGHINEFEGRLHRLELNGECPEAALDVVFEAIGWPATPLAFELVREGAALDEEAFRRYAAADTTRP